MDSAKLNDWMQVIGIFALVASLVFVGLQMKQEQEIAEAQIYAESNHLSIELANLINENRDVWVRGLGGEELSAADETVFENIYMAVLLNHGGVWQRANRLDTRSPESVAMQFAYLIFVHPGLRRMWEERRTYESERNAAFEGRMPPFEFTKSTAVVLEQLDAGSRKPPTESPRTPW